MIGGALDRNISDLALFHPIGPHVGHPKAMDLQIQIKKIVRQLSKVRCQPQALKLVLSVVFGIGHANLLAEANNRTPTLALSVVHTTELPRDREGWAGRFPTQRRFCELFCSCLLALTSDNAVKALAEIDIDRRA